MTIKITEEGVEMQGAKMNKVKANGAN